MRSITTEELKTVQLGILREVHDYCVKNGLTYYLWGGSLLGAIRHDGYIPWDDDIDIAMPRSDYERFFKGFNKDGYGVYTCEINDRYIFPYGKVFDKRTLKEENCYYKGIEFCVDLDVFPIDEIEDQGALKKDRKKRNKLISKIDWSKYVFIKHDKFVKSALKFCKYLTCCLLRGLNLLCTNRHSRKMTKKAKSFAGENNKYMLYADTNIKDAIIIERDWVDKQQLHKFENIEAYIPEGYSKLLTACFGDYMTPPPEEMRKTHHTFKTYWRD